MHISPFYFTQWLGWQTVSLFQRCFRFCDRFPLHFIFTSYDFDIEKKKKIGKNRPLFKKKFHWTKMLYLICIFNIIIIVISDLVKIIKFIVQFVPLIEESVWKITFNIWSWSLIALISAVLNYFYSFENLKIWSYFTNQFFLRPRFSKIMVQQGLSLVWNICVTLLFWKRYIYNLVNIHVKNSFYFWKISIALNKQISIDIDLCAFLCIFFFFFWFVRSILQQNNIPRIDIV